MITWLFAFVAFGHLSFPEFLDKFGKAYPTAELAKREQIYNLRVSEIDEHNKGTWGKNFVMGVNQFSDWTKEERKAHFGLNKNSLFHSRKSTVSKKFSVPIPETFPQSWDWVKKGASSKPKNQLNCGSCWAFAGTEAIESALFLRTGELAELGPQIFVDCIKNVRECGGTGGCEGGTPDLLFAYASNQTSGWGGAVLESDYPYKGKDDQCHEGSVRTHATVGGWMDVPSNNYTALMAAVMKQPVTVGVAAMNWGDYMGGVYPNELCDADIDHAVLLVGWGSDDGLGDYWKIKNSWGVGWGEDGYIRLQRNPDYCTMDNAAHDGYACADDPDSVRVCGVCGIQYGASFPTNVKLSKNDKNQVII